MLIHKDDEQTFRLIKHLSNDFDVYVHIDRKSSVNLEKYSMQNVFAMKKYKVYWGGYSQILAVHYLLKKAFEKRYDRYILISGQDLPIKSNKQIKDFFKDNKAEYIDIGKRVNEDENQEIMERLTKYWPNWFHRGKNMALKMLFRLQYSLYMIYSILRPRPVDYEFYKGANWFNITHTCVEQILHYLESNPKYLSRYKWTHCADELFYQTIILQLNGIEIVNDCLRYIDWNSIEFPKILRREDFLKIMNSNNLFARKFDVNSDDKVIDMIFEKVINTNQNKRFYNSSES
jgi:hypothetical protein